LPQPNEGRKRNLKARTTDLRRILFVQPGSFSETVLDDHVELHSLAMTEHQLDMALLDDLHSPIWLVFVGGSSGREFDRKCHIECRSAN
jgi:hypothetical protein